MHTHTHTHSSWVSNINLQIIHLLSLLKQPLCICPEAVHTSQTEFFMARAVEAKIFDWFGHNSFWNMTEGPEQQHIAKMFWWPT